MGAHPTPRDSQHIPVDPNRRPVDKATDEARQQQADKKRSSREADEYEVPDLPRMPRQYPEPTD